MKRLQKRIQDYHDRLQQILGTLPPVQHQRAERGLKALARLIQDLATDAPTTGIETRLTKLRAQLDSLLEATGELKPLAVAREAPIEDPTAAPTTDLDHWRRAHLSAPFAGDDAPPADPLRLVDDDG